MRILLSTNRILASQPSTAAACGINQHAMNSSARIHQNNTHYEEAVRLLNSLQSNAATIKKMREQRDHAQTLNIQMCRKYLESMKISMKNLDDLNIIHVSGTKGKGSTCAFVEKILRDAGLRTGLYTSPHLVHVTERIRINGAPVDEKTFTEEFFEVFQTMERYHKDNMPAYFKFLTLLAFKIFTKSQLDVAIVEVGIGGEYDCTNVIENPTVCGISTLDYDHISILGSKLSEIAWHKSGIFKQGVPAIYSPTVEEALKILHSRAASKNVKLTEAPPISDYVWPRTRSLSTGIAGRHQLLNVSLALQLVKEWATRRPIPNSSISSWVTGQTLEVPESVCQSIESCHWPGRSHIVRTSRNVTYLLDGAHTPKSMEACAEWTAEEFKRMNKNARKVLLFQCTADRCPSTLLPFLKELGFSQIISSPTQVFTRLNKSSDSTNLNASSDEQMEKAKMCVKTWEDLNSSVENGNSSQKNVFNCIHDAVECIEEEAKHEELYVLVTGSLHLVGGVLSLVAPNIN